MKHETRNMGHETDSKSKIRNPVSDFGFRISDLRPASRQGGYAALTATIIVLTVSLTIVSGLTFFALQELKANRIFVASLKARAAAEAGLEDGVYRVLSSKQIAPVETLAVNANQTTITVTDAGGQKIIRSEGTRDALHQILETRLNPAPDVSLIYGSQIGSGGLSMGSNARIIGSVYSNGSIAGNSGAEITGDATVAGGIPANPAVEWTNHNADQFFATASANRDIAQSFRAAAPGPLTQVSVYLGKAGNPAGPITLHIAADSGGIPDRTSIASVSIVASQVTANPSWVSAAFVTPPSIAANTAYWIVLDTNANSATNYWNWRKDSSDGYANNTGKYADDWRDKKAAWVDVGGDLAFRVWIGGAATTLADVTVGDASSGAGRANAFVNATIHGSPCPNSFCITDNPPQKALPFSDVTLDQWRSEAASGGTHAGDYAVDADTTMGPRKITGDLLLNSNNVVLTVAGTIYVQGNMDVSNGSAIRCAASYQAYSCVVIADGWIHIKNNGTLSGSGDPKSFLLLVSAAACDGVSQTPPCDEAHHQSAIDLHNNAQGAIFYAAHGLLYLHNNIAIMQGTGAKISMESNAAITYNENLETVLFTAPPPDGAYEITSWKEVE